MDMSRDAWSKDVRRFSGGAIREHTVMNDIVWHSNSTQTVA